MSNPTPDEIAKLVAEARDFANVPRATYAGLLRSLADALETLRAQLAESETREHAAIQQSEALAANYIVPDELIAERDALRAKIAEFDAYVGRNTELREKNTALKQELSETIQMVTALRASRRAYGEKAWRRARSYTERPSSYAAMLEHMNADLDRIDAE